MIRKMRRKLKNRCRSVKLMALLIVSFPMVFAFGLRKSYGSTVKEELREYVDCWRCVCIMFYFGEPMTVKTLGDELDGREGEHI